MNGAVAALGVVLRDPDEEERRDETDDPGGEQPAGLDAGAVEHLPDDEGQARERDGGRHVEAAVEGAHGVFVVGGFDHGDADDGGDEVDGVDDQGEEDALDAEDGIERRAEDHGADVFGGGGLEDVRATAGAVAYVVAHEVRDDGGVTWIVFGNAGFDFTNEIGAYVGGLGVDAAAELGEERHQRGPEAEADELVDDRGGVVGPTVEEEEDADAEQGKRDDDEAGDGALREARPAGLYSARACGAAAAARMLARMETYMPVKPARPEQMAPTRKLMTVRRAMGAVRGDVA